MNIFADTSAFMAVINPHDVHHRKASEVWARLVERGDTIFSTNYVILETLALAQKRHGIEAARSFNEDVVPLIIIVWVDEAIHQAGVSATLAAGLAELTIVDCVSFHVMRQHGIRAAFAFDAHFEDQGFDCNP